MKSSPSRAVLACRSEQGGEALCVGARGQGFLERPARAARGRYAPLLLLLLQHAQPQLSPDPEDRCSPLPLQYLIQTAGVPPFASTFLSLSDTVFSSNRLSGGMMTSLSGTASSDGSVLLQNHLLSSPYREPAVVFQASLNIKLFVLWSRT